MNQHARKTLETAKQKSNEFMTALLDGIFRITDLELFSFLFELRIHDDPSDKYTKYLMNLVSI